MGIDNCSSAALKGVKTPLDKKFFVTIFLYFNFYKQCWPYLFPFRKYFLEKVQFPTILLPYKKWVTY